MCMSKVHEAWTYLWWAVCPIIGLARQMLS